MFKILLSSAALVSLTAAAGLALSTVHEQYMHYRTTLPQQPEIVREAGKFVIPEYVPAQRFETPEMVAPGQPDEALLEIDAPSVPQTPAVRPEGRPIFGVARLAPKVQFSTPRQQVARASTPRIVAQTRREVTIAVSTKSPTLLTGSTAQSSGNLLLEAPRHFIGVYR